MNMKYLCFGSVLALAVCASSLASAAVLPSGSSSGGGARDIIFYGPHQALGGTRLVGPQLATKIIGNGSQASLVTPVDRTSKISPQVATNAKRPFLDNEHTGGLKNPIGDASPDNLNGGPKAGPHSIACNGGIGRKPCIPAPGPMQLATFVGNGQLLNAVSHNEVLRDMSHDVTEV